jgi:hypothetical protein
MCQEKIPAMPTNIISTFTILNLAKIFSKVAFARLNRMVATCCFLAKKKKYFLIQAAILYNTIGVITPIFGVDNTKLKIVGFFAKKIGIENILNSFFGKYPELIIQETNIKKPSHYLNSVVLSNQ